MFIPQGERSGRAVCTEPFSLDASFLICSLQLDELPSEADTAQLFSNASKMPSAATVSETVAHYNSCADTRLSLIAVSNWKPK